MGSIGYVPFSQRTKRSRCHAISLASAIDGELENGLDGPLPAMSTAIRPGFGVSHSTAVYLAWHAQTPEQIIAVLDATLNAWNQPPTAVQ
jgi:hypothetical protein